jgi:hypothetical protein
MPYRITQPSTARCATKRLESYIERSVFEIPERLAKSGSAPNARASSSRSMSDKRECLKHLFGFRNRTRTNNALATFRKTVYSVAAKLCTALNRRCQSNERNSFKPAASKRMHRFFAAEILSRIAYTILFFL